MAGIAGTGRHDAEDRAVPGPPVGGAVAAPLGEPARRRQSDHALVSESLRCPQTQPVRRHDLKSVLRHPRGQATSAHQPARTGTFEVLQQPRPECPSSERVD